MDVIGRKDPRRLDCEPPLAALAVLPRRLCRVVECDEDWVVWVADCAAALELELDFCGNGGKPGPPSLDVATARSYLTTPPTKKKSRKRTSGRQAQEPGFSTGCNGTSTYTCNQPHKPLNRQLKLKLTCEVRPRQTCAGDRPVGRGGQTRRFARPTRCHGAPFDAGPACPSVRPAHGSLL